MWHIFLYETANINKHVSKKNKTKNTFALQTVTEDVPAMVVWLLYILTMTGYSSVRERKTDMFRQREMQYLQTIAGGQCCCSWWPCFTPMTVPNILHFLPDAPINMP